MNSLVENKVIIEKDCNSNFAYVLSDNNAFNPTAYKVLQSQTDACFVKCMKMMYNGHFELYYISEGLQPLSAILSKLNAESFLTIVANLLSNIIEVKHNGFLACENIDISFEHIYVDMNTHKVSLIYLPLNKKCFDDISMFENVLRTSLVKVISQEYTNLYSPKVMHLSTDLSDGTLTLEALRSRIKGAPVPPVEKSVKIPSVYNPPVIETAGKCRIVALDAPIRVEIEITKDEFILGKKADAVDGVISFNKMISRIHCKINRSGTQYTVTDLQSANGTYVNNVRLQVNQPMPIADGDIIRMANSDFKVSIG